MRDGEHAVLYNDQVEHANPFRNLRSWTEWSNTQS